MDTQLNKLSVSHMLKNISIWTEQHQSPVVWSWSGSPCRPRWSWWRRSRGRGRCPAEAGGHGRPDGTACRGTAEPANGRLLSAEHVPRLFEDMSRLTSNPCPCVNWCTFWLKKIVKRIRYHILVHDKGTPTTFKHRQMTRFTCHRWSV